MNDEAVYRDLSAIFRDVFGREIELRPDLTAKDVEGWDSFMMIEIIIATERRFGFKFTTREIDSLRCVGDLAAIVSARAATA